MNPRVVSCVTEGIRVNVRTNYVSEESSPRHRFYYFTYRVEIINESPYDVQLLGRKWLIVDGMGEYRAVQGEGVVGKQPHLSPGTTHYYTSGVHFRTPVGRMSGYYTMVRQVDMESLKVQIPPFVMEVPYMQN